MRAAIFHGPGKPITIDTLPDPEPGPEEIVLKVHRCGICGSDLSMTGDGPFNYPLGPMGHEFAGEVVAMGRDASAFRIGDRVAVRPAVGCGKCRGCKSGNAMFCESYRLIHGGFGDYVAVPAEVAVRLPESLSFADGALVEPMACGLHSLRLARMQEGDRVLVLGAGNVGLSAVIWARQLGAGRIVVLSRSSHRADLLMAMGADAVLEFAPEDPAAIETALGGPADIVLECVGKPGLINRAIELVRPQGTVLSLGMCMHQEPISPALGTFKELSLIFPMAYTAEEFAETARLFDRGTVKPETMISDVIALDGFPDFLEEMRAGRKCLKVQVDPQ